MRNILIVAARDFRQIASMRSFWLTLLILPIAFAVAPLAQRFMEDDDVDRVMIVDRTGGQVARVLTARFELDHQRQILNALSRYVQRHDLKRADPSAPWAQHDRWYTEADIQAFAASGGLDAALARIERVRPDGVPEFDPPTNSVEFVPVPSSLASVPDTRLDAALQPLLKPADRKQEALDYALLIPAEFGRSPSVRLWANQQPGQRFVAALQEVLTRDLRTQFLQARGLSAPDAALAGTITPAIAVTQPPPGGGMRESMLVRSFLPLAASYLLMMSLMLSGSWMLQSTVEERSNKLMETVLACVSPEQMMYGKLLGTVGIGMTMMAVWVGCGALAATFTQGAIADLIRPALEPLTSAATIMAMIYFFLVGYVAIAVLFLAIGSFSESMNDAQGYLMPVILIILLPITILIQGILSGGGGVGITVLTWVPIWTPFAVLARLGSGIATWEVIGAGLLLAAFVAIELVLLGRLFRASLLSQGQRPSPREVLARMRRAPDA